MARIIVVAGSPKSGKIFMMQAISEMIKMSGYTVKVIDSKTINPDEDFNTEMDFVVCKTSKYDMNIDVVTDMVFTSKRNSLDILKHEINPEGKQEQSMDASELSNNLMELLKAQDDTISWMRSRHHSYNQNYDVPVNNKQLNNFANMNSIVSPIKYWFEDRLKTHKFEVKPEALMSMLDKISERNVRKMPNLPSSTQGQGTD